MNRSRSSTWIVTRSRSVAEANHGDDSVAGAIERSYARTSGIPDPRIITFPDPLAAPAGRRAAAARVAPGRGAPPRAPRREPRRAPRRAVCCVCACCWSSDDHLPFHVLAMERADVRVRARLVERDRDALAGPDLVVFLSLDLDLDPAQYDDETLAVLWADGIRAALVRRLAPGAGGPTRGRCASCACR